MLVGGEHIFELTDPKAVVDVILGAVALVSGAPLRVLLRGLLRVSPARELLLW